MKFHYKGISFSKDVAKMSLLEFEKMFGSNHIFKKIPHLERAKELKKVYNDLQKHYGKLSGSTKKKSKFKSKSSKA